MESKNLVRCIAGLFIAFAAIGFTVHNAGAQSDKIPGMSLGSFKVNNNGAANYTIPIIVPPGTNGIAPKLSLQYDSQKQNGLLGMGWGLEGLSIIQRCRANVAQDNFNGGINYDSSDRYCLDGARLIAMAGTDGANGTEYRTELDVFVRVFSYEQSTGNSGPLYWVVKNKAGETLEFGGNAGSDAGRIEALGKSAVRVWALSKITDVNGNFLTITYDEDPATATGDYRPTEIKYTGNGQNAGVRSVKFFYVDRTDQVPMFVGGSMVKMTKLLDKIQTFAPPPGGNAELVREYRFTYETGTTKRSRLKSLTECDKNGVCLTPHQFTFQDRPATISYSTPNVQFPPHWDPNHVWTGDFNGDGKMDLVSTNNGKFIFALSNGDGNYTTPAEIQQPPNWNTAKVWVGDFNGDGISDLVSSNGGKMQFAVFGFSNGQVTILNPSQTRINEPNGWDSLKVWAGDFNGDGRTDLTSTNNSKFYFTIFGYSTATNQVVLLNPNQSPITQPGGWDNTKVWLGDFNGDGITDLVSKNASNFLIALFAYSFSTNTVSLPNPSLTDLFPQGWAAGNTWAGDFNGDGKQDLLSFNNGTFILAFSKGDGKFYSPANPFNVTWEATSNTWVGDLNGDGKADMIQHSINNHIVRVKYSAGDGTFFDQGFLEPQYWICESTWTGDITGDGKGDIVNVCNSHITTASLDGPFPDLLVTIKNNLGGEIDIQYKPITDSSVYIKGTGAAYPIADVQTGQIYVVDNHVVSPQPNNPQAQTFTFSFDYTGAKFQFDRREGLGFNSMLTVDPQAGSRVTNIFRQDFPFTGQLSQTKTEDSNLKLFAQVTNEYTQFGTQQSQAKIVFPALTRVVKDECDGVVVNGQPSCRKSATSFEFDTQALGGKTFGNLVHTKKEGNVPASGLDDGDERHERVDWVFNVGTAPGDTTWIHRQKRIRLLNANESVTLREKFLCYDDKNTTADCQLMGSQPTLLTKGLLTKEENLLNGVLGDLANPTIIYTNDPVFGNRDSTKDPIGCITKITEFDSTNTFPKTVKRCFGEANNLEHTVQYVYDPRFGTKTSETIPFITDPPSPPKTTFTQDSFGRITTIVGPKDSPSFPLTTFVYPSVGDPNNTLGEPTSQKIQRFDRLDHLQANTILREEFFDGFGRFYQVQYDGPEDDFNVIQTIVENTEFNSRGQVSRKSAPHFINETALFTTFTYDVLGRQRFVTHPDNRQAESQYDRGEVTLIDENGHEKIKVLDAYDQIVEVDEINHDDNNVEEIYVTLYEFNAAGQLTKMTQKGRNNEFSIVTTTTYDNVGRKIEMLDPNMGQITYEYDNAGNLTKQVTPNLRALSKDLRFEYDKQSRIKKKTYPDTKTITYFYDTTYSPAPDFPVSRLTKVDDQVSNTTSIFQYDEMGRNTRLERTIDSTTYVEARVFNALSKVKTESFPPNGLSDTIEYTYDEAGWLKTVTGFIDVIKYNARGQKTYVAHSNQVNSTFEYYDQPGDTKKNFLIKSKSTTGPVSQPDPDGVLQDLTYFYDNVGSIIGITDGKFTGTRDFGHSLNASWYDDLNRLKKAAGTFAGNNQGQTTETYSYDALGNILNKAGITYEYCSHPIQPAPLQHCSGPLHPSAVARTFDPNTSTEKIYHYDANGNTKDGNGRVFTWTPDDRVAYIVKDSNTTTMDYDYTGDRLKKTGPLGLTLYPFTDYEIGTDGVAMKYIQLGSEILAAKKSTGEKLFYHNDHLGGINVISSSDGNKRTQLTEYDPWGRISRDEGSGDPRKRFTGQEYDPEIDLYYYVGRYYDQNLAKFVSPDPFIPVPHEPQSINRYSYVVNNPVNLTDPTGYSFWGIILQVVGFVLSNSNSFAGAVTSIDLDTCNCTKPGYGSNIQGSNAGQAGAVQSSVQQGTGPSSQFDQTNGQLNVQGGDLRSFGDLQATGNFRVALVAQIEGNITSLMGNGTFFNIASQADKYQLGRQFGIEDDAQNLYGGTSSKGMVSETEQKILNANKGGVGRCPGCTPESEFIRQIQSGEREATSAAAVAAKEAKQGIYEFRSSTGQTYVGQSGDICCRIQQHLNTGNLPAENVSTVTTQQVTGGKTAREVAEQLRINELGGVKNLKNVRNPIGPARQDLLPK